MESKILSGKSAKGIASVLKTVLKIEANTCSCALVYQPKAPKDLQKYRRER